MYPTVQTPTPVSATLARQPLHQDCHMENTNTLLRIFSASATRSDISAMLAMLSHLPRRLAKICRAETGNQAHHEYEPSSRTGYWVVFRTKLVTYYAVVGIGRSEAHQIAMKLRRLKEWTDETFRRAATHALYAH